MLKCKKIGLWPFTCFKGSAILEYHVSLFLFLKSFILNNSQNVSSVEMFIFAHKFLHFVAEFENFTNICNHRADGYY